jgi:predicted RNA-binding Zn-ribbon protein involved in translation (DUF1610 family)
MSDERLRLDGNAAAGRLTEIYPFDMTTAQCTCATCGWEGPLGSMLLYGGAMGTILRCPTCEQVLIRITHIRARFMMDMRGLSAMMVAPTLLA